MSLRIGIDIDDVITASTSRFVNFYNGATGSRFSLTDITAWDWADFTNDKVTREQFKALYNAFVSTGEIERLLPVPGAVMAINELSRRHDIYFVSARTSNGISDTYRWFEKYELPMDKVYFDKDKGWQAKVHNLDIFVDDGLHNLVNVKNTNPRTRTIVYTRPWNELDGGQRHAIDYRAKDWRDVKLYVTGIERGRLLEEDGTDPDLIWGPQRASRWLLPESQRDE